MPLAEIHVTLKPALFDAQGQTIKKALLQLGHTGVSDVRIGKYITVEVNGDPVTLQSELDQMCRQLLANPVMEDYEITVSGLDAVQMEPIALAQSVEIASAPAPAAVLHDETVAVTPNRVVAPATQVGATSSTAPEPVATPGGVTDPFQVDFRSYEAMPTEAKMALRTLALRKYGTWIEGQLKGRSAAWVLCLGQDVLESGPTIDSYPSDQHLLKMGIQHDRVPWVFTRPN
ncbi:phosphoribosylformylglycinamidine synthase subunit PurS [Abditibacteriota bacterium]|nr:phosphoribosylformylglycinamidine synthase subunit PurS [Abditibacteriota bacterium]